MSVRRRPVALVLQSVCVCVCSCVPSLGVRCCLPLHIAVYVPICEVDTGGLLNVL